MVYVQRDEHGRLLRVEHEPFDAMTGEASAGDPEVRSWLASHALHSHLMSLQHSDLELVRVIEDLVSVLVSRGLIRYTDLPEAARSKLSHRAQARAQLDDLGKLVDEQQHLPY